MDVCPPAIATAAAFVAVILIDLYTRDWRRAPGHALLGVFAVLLMIFICQRGSHTMAWILLAAPFVFIALAWIFRAHSEMTKYDTATEQTNAWDGNGVGYGCPCPCCGAQPCHCMRPCREPKPCQPRKKKCGPKNPPCNEDSYFELWLTTKGKDE
jgi:hypothetical protein